MARIFITGSSDGLGLSAARLLVEQGHGVVLHARPTAGGRGSGEASRSTSGGCWGPHEHYTDKTRCRPSESTWNLQRYYSQCWYRLP
jgi:NAD(P)-dependent dehydrogenase (short-subunit alcohol dehydrogenase family)